MLNVSPSIVRLPTLADYQELWRLLLQDHNESGIFQADYVKVDWLLMRLLQPHMIPPNDTGTRGTIGVIGPERALEAIVVLVVSAPWYSSELCLNDLVAYVDPNYRHSGHAKALIEWMKGQSAATGISLISGVMSRERTEAKCRLFQRQMPERIGSYFLFDPKAVVLTSSGTGLNGYKAA